MNKKADACPVPTHSNDSECNYCTYLNELDTIEEQTTGSVTININDFISSYLGISYPNKVSNAMKNAKNIKGLL